MTTPGQNLPPESIGGGDISPLANLSEATWRATQFGKIEGFDEAHTGFGIPGLRQRITDNFVAFEDGQRALNDRLDLLDQVSGYGVLTTGADHEMSGAGSYVNFPSRIGPMKNVVATSGGFRFEGAGTWRLDAQITVSGMLSLSTFWSLLEIRVLRNGQVWSKAAAYTDYAGRNVSAQAWHNVVIPDDGAEYRARVWIKLQAAVGRVAPRGDQFQKFSCNRWDLSTDGPLNPAPAPDLDNPG